MIENLLGSLMGGANASAPRARPDPERERQATLEAFFGRAAPQAEEFLRSPHAGKAAGAATIVLGALFLPKLAEVLR